MRSTMPNAQPNRPEQPADARMSGWVDAWHRVGPRWPAAAAVLLLEYLALGLRVDAYALNGRGLYGFEYLGSVATVALATVVATVVLRGSSLTDDLAAARQTRHSVWTWGLLMLHGMSFTGLWALSLAIFDSPNDAMPDGAWLGAWVFAALMTPAALIPVVVVPRKLPALAQRLSPSLAIGLAVGAVTVVLGHASGLLWRELGHYTLDASFWSLSQLTEAIVYVPEELVLGTPEFVVTLGPACSGFEGMGLIAALLGGYIYVHRNTLRFPHVLTTIPLAIAAVWFANVARITALILIGAHWSPAVAVGGFHSRAGWVIFCAIAMLAVVAIQHSKFLSRTDPPGQTNRRQGTEDSAAAYLLPLMTLIATGMLTGMAAAEVDMRYGMRIATTAACLFALRAAYTEPRLRPTLLSVGVGIGVYAMWAALVPPTTASGTALRDQVSALSPLGAGAWIAVRAVGSTLVIPIAEELAFRGFLLRRLVARNFESVPRERVYPVALCFSSLAFGALHGAWIAGTLAGLAFGLVQARRGRTGDAIIAHMVSNALVSAQVLLLGHWGLWA